LDAVPADVLALLDVPASTSGAGGGGGGGGGPGPGPAGQCAGVRDTPPGRARPRGTGARTVVAGAAAGGGSEGAAQRRGQRANAPTGGAIPADVRTYSFVPGAAPRTVS